MSPAGLGIPEAAYEAAECAVRPHLVRAPDVAADDLHIAVAVLHAAAPLIVVAELRRLADGLEVVAREMAAEDDRNIRSSALGEGVRRLRDRADELDGGAR